MPVIILAADGRFKSTPNDMQELQRCLLGAAQVAALTSPAATERLTALLGPDRACPAGVLRIYYPLFARDSPPQHHPLLHAKDLQAAKKIELFLHQRAMRTAGMQIPDGPVIRAARAAVCVEMTKHSEIVATWMTRATTAEGKLQSLENERNRLKEELDEARQFLRSAQGKLTEQARTEVSQADEVLMLKEKLDTLVQEVAKLRSEHALLLEQTHEKSQALGQAEYHLRLMRKNEQTQARPPVLDGEVQEELRHAWQENGGTLAELEATRQDLAALQGEWPFARRIWT